MSDTTPDIKKRIAAMMAARSPAERLRMACQMNDTGRILLRAGIKKENPGFTEAQIRGQILFRLYRDDFTSSELRHIASRIPNMHLDLPADEG